MSEPHVWARDNELVTTPTGYANWVKMLPTTQSEDRWAVRNMLWIRKGIQAEQLPADSYDLTVVLLYLQDYTVLIVSTYIPGNDQRALVTTIRLIDKLISDIRRKAPKEL